MNTQNRSQKRWEMTAEVQNIIISQRAAKTKEATSRKILLHDFGFKQEQMIYKILTDLKLLVWFHVGGNHYR